MLKKEMSKKEVEEEILGKGDFVQIDYLTRFLKEDISIDMKKFVYLKLAQVYERKGMFVDCAKMYENAANFSVTFSEKIKNYVRAGESYIKAGSFDKVDEAMKKAFAEANATQKGEIYFTIKDFYKKQAEIYENEMKKNNAVKIYERLMGMKLSDIEKEEIKNHLLRLYDKLGKIREAGILRGG